jgi:endonuclease I
MELKPCNICINSLRYKLFEIKTKTCMKNYYEIKTFAYQNIHDIYTGKQLEEVYKKQNRYNIEHVIPVSIFKGRYMNKYLYINREPYSDPHILFPTFKEINDLRQNYVYGQLAQNRDGALHNNNITVFSNQGYIYDGKSEESKNKVKEIFSKLDEKNDIYVSNLYGNFCPIGECIFQPSKKITGEISRIVFYFYLMYAYDPNKRPYTNNEPWLYDDSCTFFDMDSWNIFFNKHIDEYYKWSKTPIHDYETNKNIKIIDEYIIPNIFIGYYNNDGIYITIPNIIDELFFGKEHDHHKYTDIFFYKDSYYKYDNKIYKEVDCSIND